MDVRAFVERHRRVLLEALLIFGVALVPRLIGLGLFITADEKQWIGRGYEFLKAFREFRINDTLQTTHPGITTLWVSGIATFLATRVFGTPFNFGDLHRFVTFAQVPMAVINALLAAGIFLSLRLILPRGVALLGGLVIAFDPFLIGHSKVVHVDAFLTGFLVIAAALFIYAEERKNEWASVASALAAALAILTKLPAVIIIPFAIVVLMSRRGAWTRIGLRDRARTFGRWLFMLLVVVLLLWPALLWVPNPLGNVNQVRKDITVAYLIPHDMEESYTLNVWQYPATMLTRTTPSVLLGLAALLVLLTIRRGHVFRFLPRRPFLLLVAFLLLFLLLMIVGAKKGDRYILPIFPILDVLGAAGVLAAAHLFMRARAARIAAVLLLFPTLVLLFRLGPYTLAYYNPLFPPNLSQELGWGEGLDQVAKYLDAEPGNAYVASWYPEELRALTKKPVLHINAHRESRMGYIVLYRNMFGRPPSHWANDFIDEYYKKREPAFIAHVNGLEYAWVYKVPIFSAIVGELLPSRVAVAEVRAPADNLARIDVTIATYTGKATAGTLTMRLRERIDGPDLRAGTVPVSEIRDNDNVQFHFDPVPGTKGKTLFVIVTADGTREGNAPTVRVAPLEKNDRYAVLRRERLTEQEFREKEREGRLAVRLFFRSNGQELSEEEAERQQSP
jgi:dolichyl-phosphate-mannose-protein mannosyltransferase